MPIVDRVIQRVVGSTLRRVLHDTTNLSTLENGIHLDFSTGTYYRKVAGQDAIFEPFTSMFTFTSGNQSMYTGPSGLLVQSVTNTPRIEWSSTTIGTNLLQQSQTFDNATWIKTGITISANATTAPDGTLTADAAIEDTSGASHAPAQSVSVIAGGVYTLSFYAKYLSRTLLTVRFSDAGDANGVITQFNLQLGTITSAAVTFGTGASAASSITSVGNGWYRCTLTGTSGSVATTAFPKLRLVNGGEGYTGDGVSGTYFWGAQLELGTTASVYTVTTSTVPAYTNSTPSCLGLLMEAARTNLAIQSFDLSAYTLTGITVGSNVIAGPDGAVTADSMIEDASTGLHRAGGTSVGAANVTNTCSFFVKAGTRSKGRVRMGGVSGSTIANFDLVAKTITPVTPSGNGTTTGATITELANGWFRVTATGVPDSTSGLTFQPSCDLADAAFTFSYTGTNATIGAYCTGFQVEAAAFASSYIPTTTVSVARTADSCIRTLGSEFSATAGTVVLAGRTSGGQDSVGQTIIEFDDTTSNERHTITRAATTDTVRYNMFDGGVLQSSLDSASLGNREAFKSAWAWALNDIAQSTNGGAVNTDTGATLPTVTQLVLAGPGGNGNSFMNGHIRTFDYYPTRENNGFLQRAST